MREIILCVKFEIPDLLHSNFDRLYDVVWYGMNDVATLMGGELTDIEW